MSKVFDVLAGIGILIGIYLFIANWNGTVKIIDTLATNAISGVKTLQGR